MSKTNNNIPSASPEKPQADFLGIVQQLQRLTEVRKDELLDAEEIAGKVFLFLSDIPDHNVLGGVIKDDRHSELRPYVTALNALFPLVKNADTGAINQLNSNTVEKLSPRAYAKVAVIGGRPFVEVMCDIVNAEVEGRVPKHDVEVRGAYQAFPLTHDHGHSSATPAA